MFTTQNNHNYNSKEKETKKKWQKLYKKWKFIDLGEHT